MNASLAKVLACYPAQFQPLSTPEPLGNAGGWSGARLWRYPSGRGALVARSWPIGVDKRHIEQVHGWIARASYLGFVPVPIPAMDGKTVQEEGGAFWELSPWMPGTDEVHAPPTMGKVISAFTSLAAFHQAIGPRREISHCPGLAARSREITNLLKQDLLSWRRAVLSRVSDPRSVLALKWLRLAEQIAPRLGPEVAGRAGLPTSVQPVLRDARPEHFLFTGDVLTGLVDFGAMEIDSVSADLARLLSEWIEPNRVRRAKAIAAYSRVNPLDSLEFSMIDTYERSAALLGGGRWVKWHFVDRIEFDDPTAVLQGLRRGVKRIEGLISGEAGISGFLHHPS